MSISGTSNNWAGVILAGGRGKRMFPLLTEQPKALLPICNESIIQRQIRLLKSANVDRIYIVIGQGGSRIVEHLSSPATGIDVPISYLEQHSPLGIAHALGILEDRIDGPMIVMLGDLYLEISELCDAMLLVEKGDAVAVLASKLEPRQDKIASNYSIVSDADSRVTRVVEKPRIPFGMRKGCGLYLFDPHVFDAIRRTPRTGLRDEYEITESIQILIEDHLPVRHADIVVDDWNINSCADLLNVNMIALKKMNVDRLVAEDAVIPESAVLSQTVIGRRAELSNVKSLKECVVFDNVRMFGPLAFSRCLLTSVGCVPC